MHILLDYAGFTFIAIGLLLIERSSIMVSIGRCSISIGLELIPCYDRVIIAKINASNLIVAALYAF